MSLPVVRTIHELRREVSLWRQDGFTVGFAPTMGALHEGHLSLVRLLGARCERIVASVFVNPKQFAAHEDLGGYPRDEAGDLAKLAAAGCHLAFAPDAGEMYPPGFSTAVTVGGISAPLEGAARPAFFGGVATVVAKLLLQCLPDAAAFGEKDYQQLLVIRRLAHDLNIPVEIVAGETVRESDGLALSSRNVYLSPAERATAGQLNVVLRQAVERLQRGEPIASVETDSRARLAALGFGPIDYFAVRDAGDLSPLARLDRPARLLAAAWLGKTRLIDNFAVGGVVL